MRHNMGTQVTMCSTTDRALSVPTKGRNTMKNLDNAFNHWLSGGDEDFALEEAINYLEKTGTEDAA